jgi:transposase
MPVVCYAKSAGPNKRRVSVPVSMMTPRLLAGKKRPGQPEKKAQEQGSTLVFVDESSFYLLPQRVKTYAPCGHTPELRVPLTHDHLSAISAISSDHRLFFQVHEHSCKTGEVIRFLRVLLQKIRGHIIVLWDGAPIHRSNELQHWLARGAARRLHLERLPAYAPDVNPDEGIWQYLKEVALCNQCFPDLS